MFYTNALYQLTGVIDISDGRNEIHHVFVHNDTSEIQPERISVSPSPLTPDTINPSEQSEHATSLRTLLEENELLRKQLAINRCSLVEHTRREAYERLIRQQQERIQEERLAQALALHAMYSTRVYRFI